MKLYTDQEDTLNKLRQEMTRHKSVLLQAPTGFGKTALAVNMLANAKSKGRRVVFTVPRKDLLFQTSMAFKEYGIDHGFVASGYEQNPFKDSYIGMIDTMARRMDRLPQADLVIFDEAHYGQENLNKIITHYKAAGAYVVGLSATPWKLSGEGLGKWFSSMVAGPSIKWLIDNGRLSKYRMFAPNTPDLSSLGVTAGDYASGELAKFMEGQRAIIGDSVKHYREKAMGMLNLAFCASINHARMVADSFNDAGIAAASIDGSMGNDERREIIRRFARREILVLTNCNLCTFGFDLSMASGMDVTVECMSDLRPTKSLALQMQKYGRVLRRKNFPALIFDHAGNALEHGLPCADREWSLDDRKQGKRGGDRTPPTRQCSQCYFVHTPAPNCPECGYEYPIVGRKVKEADGELVEVDIEQQRLAARKEQGSARTLDELIELGKRRGYAKPYAWASKVLAGRMMSK